MDTNPIFPEKIIVNILTRLPAETLHRFKCVSKPWLSLITSPRFLKAYLTLSPPHPQSWMLTHRVASVLPSLTQTLAEAPDPLFSLSKPPNVSYFTLSPPPDVMAHSRPPFILTSSAGLILLVIENFRLLIANPVTNDRAMLPPFPTCDSHTPSVAALSLAVKYTSSDDDVSLVVIQIHDPTPTETLESQAEGATLIRYTSDTGEWEKTRAMYSPGSRRAPHGWEVHDCLEVNGKIFWVIRSSGVFVLDDPFGERMELRFIPLPDGQVKPHNTPNLLQSRFIYSSGGFVMYGTVLENEGRMIKFWRLTDVEKGEWNVVFTAAKKRASGLPDGLGVLGISAFHPFHHEVAVMTVQDKCLLVNMKKAEVVGKIGKCERHDEDDLQRPYYPVVLPCWPTPIPKRLGAISFKETGNMDFGWKNFEDAIYYYSRSISCLPTAAAYANRAAAYLKLGNYQEAEIDCSEALKLDDQYLKVYARRATARKGLRKLWEAKEDVEMALKLDGGLHEELLKLSSEINCLLEKEM